MATTREFRGISPRLATRYLENLGGERRSGDPEAGEEPIEVVGDGWSAELTSEKVAVGPSVQLTEVRVAFEGDEGVDLDDLIDRFAQKAMRAGG